MLNKNNVSTLIITEKWEFQWVNFLFNILVSECSYNIVYFVYDTEHF